MATLVVRQPILAADGRPVAGHLACHDASALAPGSGSSLPHSDSASLGKVGASVLPGRKPMLVGVGRDVISSIGVLDLEYIGDPERGTPSQPLPFGPDAGVVEVSADSEPSGDLLDGIHSLREYGYGVALADGPETTAWAAFSELFDMVSVDFADHPGPAWRKMIDRYFANRSGAAGLAVQARFGPVPRVFARGIGHPETLRQAKEIGYGIYQGTWYTEYDPSSNRRPVRRLAALELLRELQREEFRPRRLESIVKTDATLSRDLLVRLNSAAVGLGRRVTSIQHAIILMGEDEFRRWATMATLATAASGKVEALLVAALGRARLCELLAARVPQKPGHAGELSGRSDEAFLVGLLSLLDVVCGLPMDEVLAELPLADDVCAALSERSSGLHDALVIARALERAEWRSLADACEELGVDGATVAECQAESSVWVAEVIERQHREASEPARERGRERTRAMHGRPGVLTLHPR